MFSLPGKTFHAIEAVLYIALNSTQMPVSGKEIAERQGVPPRYLEQLMQKLVRARLLRGVRGPRGGYVLARERRRITLADICGALHEGPEETPPSTALAKEVVMPAWSKAQGKFREVLAAVTLADLCAAASSRHIGRDENKTDFTI